MKITAEDMNKVRVLALTFFDPNPFDQIVPE